MSESWCPHADNKIIICCSEKKEKCPDMPIDYYFLDALKQGRPECAGIAVGIDQLLMVMTGTEGIRDVLNFPIGRA